VDCAIINVGTRSVTKGFLLVTDRLELKVKGKKTKTQYPNPSVRDKRTNMLRNGHLSRECKKRDKKMISDKSQNTRPQFKQYTPLPEIEHP